MIPLFLRFYSGYTLSSVMQEYAISFFALCNEMVKIEALESLNTITEQSVMHREDGQEIVDAYRQQAKGADEYIEQAKVLRNVIR